MEHNYIYYGDLKHNLVRQVSNPDDMIFMNAGNLWVDKTGKLNFQNCDYQGSTAVLTAYSDINIMNNVITYENTDTKLPSTAIMSRGGDVWEMGDHIYYDSYQTGSHYELNSNNEWVEHTWTVRLLNGNTYTVKTGMSHATSYWVDFNGLFVWKWKGVYYSQMYYKEPSEPITSIATKYNSTRNRWEQFQAASGYYSPVGYYGNRTWRWDDGTDIYISSYSEAYKWNDTAQGWERISRDWPAINKEGQRVTMWICRAVKVEGECYTTDGYHNSWKDNAVVDIYKWNKTDQIWEYYNTITLPSNLMKNPEHTIVYPFAPDHTYVQGKKVYFIYMDDTLAYYQRIFEIPIVKEE